MGGQGSGGANGGPQYNPANVSATGGNGTNGDYTGFAYGQNKAVNDARVQGNQAVSAIQASEPASNPNASPSPFDGLETLHSTPAEIHPVSHGSDFGRGADSSILPSIPGDVRLKENQAIAKQYLPLFVHVAKSPDTPDSFKRFINFLAGTIS